MSEDSLYSFIKDNEAQNKKPKAKLRKHKKSWDTQVKFAQNALAKSKKKRNLKLIDQEISATYAQYDLRRYRSKT